MNADALQGRAANRTVEDLRRLLMQGEAHSPTLAEMDSLTAKGLWITAGKQLTASPALVSLGNQLPRADEAIPAIIGLLPDIRAEWLRIVRARLAEMGERQDLKALIEAINASGALAAELLTVGNTSLAATPFGDLERATLPAAAHEAAAFPVLLRTLAATAAMPPTPPPPQLPQIVADDPGTAWRRGRLLRLPETADTEAATAVLSGALEGRNSEGDAMHWALDHPWAFLLAQFSFTKEAWEAERVSGGINFELESAHLPLLEQPPRVEVVVTLPSGEEIRCGSLGELVLRTLAQLGVVLLAHRIDAATLDDKLGLVIGALLRRDVWRFEHATGGRRPGYAIHPAFSDACYRALGSRAFYRLGAGVTAAIRGSAESWARERMARAGAAAEETA